MAIVEPPSCNDSIVFIGKNNSGQWVARERNGLFGGLFINQHAALRYALFENHQHPEAIVAVTALELDIGVISLPEIASSAPSRHAA